MKSFWLRITIAILLSLAVVAALTVLTGRSVSFPESRFFTSEKKVRVVIGGDIMLDRNIRKLGQEKGYAPLAAGLAPAFMDADIAVANLEGPVTTKPSKTLLPDGSYGKVLHFTFAPESLEAVKAAGISLVSLANNHTDNFYASGLTETKVWLAREGISWFGDPWNRVTSSTTHIWSKDGISIAFVGYHAFLAGFEDILAEVSAQSAAGHLVIIMPHWGEEYATEAGESIRGQARRLIVAGADAVIGSHPHVIMDHEWIGSVPVYYSLGNLLFDQYFSEDVMNGLIVELTIARRDDGSAYVEGVKTHRVRNSSQNGASLL